MNEIEIKFTLIERDLIIDHTFAGPDLTKRLQIAEIKGKHLIEKGSSPLLTCFAVDDSKETLWPVPFE